MKHLLTVTRVYKHVNCSPLAQSLTTSLDDGARLKLESVVDFDLDGGQGVFEPNTARAEAFLYSSVDETTDELVGVTRPNTKYAHASGTFVQEGLEATVEKLADGYLDDEQVPAVGIPVPASLYPLLKVGARDDETAETIWISTNEEEDLFVSEGPVGAVPVFDEDLEVLPAVGGGDATKSTTQSDGKVQPPKGMGYEDGKPPSTGVTPTVVGGIGTLFVRFPTIANNSQVTYKVHIHTTAGFTPGANTQVGTLVLAGTPGFTGVVSIKDFPAGHVLDGTAADPPKAGTTYEALVIPADGSGDFPGPYARASGTPVKVATADVISGAITADLIAAAAITSTKIEDGAISTPKLAAGAVTAVKITAGTITANEVALGTLTSDQIAANTIVGGDIAGTTITGTNIAGTTITADKLSVSNLSAISANLGTVNAGSITGVDITGGTFRTASTAGMVVEISSTNRDKIRFTNGPGGTELATIQCQGPTNPYLFITTNAFGIGITGGTTTVDHLTSLGRVKAEKLVCGPDASAPDPGYVAIYKNGNLLQAKDPSGTVRTLATF